MVERLYTYLYKVRRLPWRLLIVAAVMAVVVPCRAQNNPLKINDQLYNMYDAAFRQRTTAAGRDLAMQMYRRAVGINDRRAQVLALTIPVLYYYGENNDAEFEKAVKTLQDKALQYHSDRYYYYAVANKVNYMLVHHRMYEALTYSQSILEYARKNHSTYGIYSSLNTLGNVHLVRMEIGLSLIHI